MELDLMKLFEGYVRNYHTFQLSFTHGNNSATFAEIGYFARLGSMLGYWTFTEDTVDGNGRPMDLSWWDDYDPQTLEWSRLVLHLERENLPNKAEETLDKLFADEDTRPAKAENVVGIMTVMTQAKIDDVVKQAKKQCNVENALLVFRLKNLEVQAFHFKKGELHASKKAVVSEYAGILHMVFEEEHMHAVGGAAHGV